MSERLVPKRLVDQHETKLRVAVTAAWQDQLVKLTVTLRSHGIVLPAVTAAGKPAIAAIAHVAVPNLWSQSEWLRNLSTHLDPVAQAVAQEALDAASNSVRIPSLWGQADTTDETAQAIRDRAVSTGQWIGNRLDIAATKGSVPKAITAATKPKPPQTVTADELPGEMVGDVVEIDMASVLATAPDILGNLIGAMANATATMASNDVTQYLASYVTSAEADPYLSATKSWVNMGDDSVRDTHDGVEDVPINELFDVGGGMVGPGDPAGPDDETANCRCHVEYDGVVPEGSGYEAGQAPQYQGEGYSEPDMEGEGA